jgi:chromosome segregation ATPase
VGHETLDSRLMSCILCLMSCVFLIVTGCSAKGQYINTLFAAASSQLASAQKAGADQLAESEFEEARDWFTQAEAALRNKDKQARFLIQKAHAKARLAEALARQVKAESELAQLEAELEEASAEANRVRLEREAAETELAGLPTR